MERSSIRALRITAIAVGIVWIISAANPAGYAAQTANYRLVQPGYLVVATYGSAVPALTIGPNDELGALDGAWINAFAKDQGLKVKLYQTTFASVIIAVEQGKVDLGTYYYYKPERAQQVYFTYPFFQEHAALFTLKSLPYTGPDSMKGKKVATVVGYVWAPYLQTWGGANAVLLPASAAAQTALLNGQVDGYVDSDDSITGPVFSAAKDRVALHELNAGDFGFPESTITTPAYNFVKCDNKPLAAAMNDQMAKLHTSGEWAKVLAANDLTSSNDVSLQAPQQLCH